jgi:Ankyrin repeats (many copies)
VRSDRRTGIGQETRTGDPLTAFLRAACVTPGTTHAEGTLDEAEAIRTRHPDVATASVHAAAALGDDDAVRRFLALDPAHATARGGPHGWDALTHLCFSRYLRLDRARSDGFVRAAEALLDAGASADGGWHETDSMWESVLYGAAGIAHQAGLTRLLLERGADPNDDETPYHAPESYDNAAMQALVESGRLTADSLATLLLRKADWHDPEGVRFLLARGADPNRMTRWGRTAFQHAVLRDNALQILEAMLGHGADPSLADVGGRSSLSLAAHRGRGDLLELCERRGISVELHGADRLLAACARDDDAAVHALAAAEPQFVREVLAEGGRLLAQFAGVGNTGGVRHLLDLGIPADARYEEGDGYFGTAPNSTALHVAAWRARPATVRLLLERGTPADAPDGWGRTPLALAVRACVDSYWTDRRTPESVQALLDTGASVRGVPFPSGYAEVDDLLRQAGAAG